MLEHPYRLLLLPLFFAAFVTIASNYMVNHTVNVPSEIIEYDYDRKQATVQFLLMGSTFIRIGYEICMMR